MQPVRKCFLCRPYVRNSFAFIISLNELEYTADDKNSSRHNHFSPPKEENK